VSRAMGCWAQSRSGWMMYHKGFSEADCACGCSTSACSSVAGMSGRQHNMCCLECPTLLGYCR
jgi:hypothetical protein